MIDSLTTGQCADILNTLVGMRAYSSDFILGQVEDHLLTACVYHPRGAFRRRAYVRIHPDDLRAYIAQYHPALLSTFDARFTWKCSDQAS